MAKKPISTTKSCCQPLGGSIYSGGNKKPPHARFQRFMTTVSTVTSKIFAMPFFTGAVEMDVHSANSAANARLQEVAFQHAWVALAAKLAAVDGAVNSAEYAAYGTIITPSPEFDALRLRSLFTKHVADKASALQYARSIASLTRGNQARRESLLQQLLMLATSDAALNAAEMELLRAVAQLFDISRDAFKAIVARHLVPQRSPYEVMGIASDATPEQTRARYLALVQKLHPDRYQATGASEETMAMLSDQLAALNAAYATIKRHQSKHAAPLARWWKNTKGAKAS